jgi:hypothetical protein
MAFIDEARLLMPWLPEGMLQAYVDGYTEYGDEELAWAYVRSSDGYDDWVPGNRREDGSLRHTELEYFSNMDAYWNAVLSVGVNPQLYKSRGDFVNLIEGEVSPDEFASRLDTLHERVLETAPEVRRDYAERWGIDLPRHALIASLMSPEIGQQILDRQITISEISAEAVQHGFGTLTDRFARDLWQEGVDAASAEGLFDDAAMQLPVLSVLARRHADPDDDFDLEEFTAAAVFDDPEQRRRIRRLVAQEQSLFNDLTASSKFQQIGGPGGRLLTGLGDI